MDLATLQLREPWDWPKTAAETIRKVLRDRSAKPEDRLLAAEMAGENVVMDEEMAGRLVAVVGSKEEPEPLRARAAISLGPVLEECDMEGFDEDDPMSAPPISEGMFHEIQATLRRVHDDASAGKELRRRALEAAVRAEDDWHAEAVRAAYASDDPEWKLTGVFGMQYVKGFDEEILKSLKSVDPEIRFEAVRAAGNRELRDAWPEIEALLSPDNPDRDLLMAAIEASVYVNPEEASDLLAELETSEDEEISQTAIAAMEMCGVMSGEDGEPDEDEEEEEE